MQASAVGNWRRRWLAAHSTGRHRAPVAVPMVMAGIALWLAISSWTSVREVTSLVIPLLLAIGVGWFARTWLAVATSYVASVVTFWLIEGSLDVIRVNVSVVEIVVLHQLRPDVLGIPALGEEKNGICLSRREQVSTRKEFSFVPESPKQGNDLFVDSYRWRNGVGAERTSHGDFRWGVIDPNTFGTHEFVALCRKIGAEPYICLNGLADPRENLDWVAYCNATEGPMAELRKANGHPAPLNVKYWSVGNERYD